MSVVVRLRPTPADVIEACATAARLLRHGRDDIAVSVLHHRARHLAIAAMLEGYPALRLRDAAQIVGLRDDELHGLERRHADAKKYGWWDDAIVEEVLGVFMADELGERAR